MGIYSAVEHRGMSSNMLILESASLIKNMIKNRELFSKQQSIISPHINTGQYGMQVEWVSGDGDDI